MQLNRRDLLITGGSALAISLVSTESSLAQRDGEQAQTIVIDPKPDFELSPFLYMQFMEPLGTNDSSVEAGWDHLNDCWREGLIETTRSLAPPMIRWGGLISAYYRWKEAVGPRSQRIPMINIEWGGVETNQIGTAEFVDFCKQVRAEALMCVNFESEGRPVYRQAKGSTRVGDASEAAAWVAYCNQEKDQLRLSHGVAEPYKIRFWQIGNETSYSRQGFPLETAATKTLEYAKAMRQVDPSIQLIGWADNGWGKRMAEVAGEELQYLAFHDMFNPDDPKSPVLRGERYREDPLATWQILMNAWKTNDAKIRRVRDSLKGCSIPLALTECHFAVPGNNRNDVLRTWAAGVSYARILNNHQRHGDAIKIATAADFCGTRWTVNAVLIGTHPNKTYLMPVGLVMRQYRRYLGEHSVAVTASPENLDCVASRTGDRVFVNVVNTSRDRTLPVAIQVDGATIAQMRGTLLVEQPMVEISSLNCQQVMQPKEMTWQSSDKVELPPASVTSIEITLQA
jgi:alpha-L-arabinofuranosidase